MTESINRQWLLTSRPKGMVAETDFLYRETTIPATQSGEFLVRNLYIAFEPAMRGWMMDRPSYIPPIQLGEVMRAFCVGQVVESKHTGFKLGDFVRGMFGWQDYIVTNGATMMPVIKIPPGQSLTSYLSVFGITGLTAYFGLLDVGKPQAGDTVVVSGAAGATGSIAGQIAKIQGCRVIGIAGGPNKCRWLTSQAGFDAAIDCRAEDIPTRFEEFCPNGINIFVDNVGGEILDAALALMALKARVVLCGGISRYNEEILPPGPKNYFNLVIQRARMEGFIVLDYAARFEEAAQKLGSWISAGKIAFKEDIQEGFENAPRAFLRLFKGENFGKQLLKIADPARTAT